MKTIQVSVKVKAIDTGYYQNRIIQAGEEFTYKGGLNSRGGLPLWVEAMEEFNLPEAPKAVKPIDDKKVEVEEVEEVEAEASAPSKKASKKVSKKSAPSLADSLA